MPRAALPAVQRLLPEHPALRGAARRRARGGPLLPGVPNETRPQAAAGRVPPQARAAHHQVPAAAQRPRQQGQRGGIPGPGGSAGLHAGGAQVRQRQHAPGGHHGILGRPGRAGSAAAAGVLLRLVREQEGQAARVAPQANAAPHLLLPKGAPLLQEDCQQQSDVSLQALPQNVAGRPHRVGQG